MILHTQQSIALWFENFAYNEYPHAKALARYLLRNIGAPEDDAEDIVQEVFLIAYKKSSLLYSHPNQRAWIYRVTHFVFKNYYRHHKKVSAETSLDENLRDTTFPPEDIVALRDLLDIAASQLSQRDYSLYCSIYMHDQSLEQVAHLVGQKPATVARQISRMNERLRKIIIHLSEIDRSGHNIDERGSEK